MPSSPLHFPSQNSVPTKKKKKQKRHSSNAEGASVPAPQFYDRHSPLLSIFSLFLLNLQLFRPQKRGCWVNVYVLLTSSTGKAVHAPDEARKNSGGGYIGASKRGRKGNIAGRGEQSEKRNDRKDSPERVTRETCRS